MSKVDLGLKPFSRGLVIAGILQLDFTDWHLSICCGIFSFRMSFEL